MAHAPLDLPKLTLVREPASTRRRPISGLAAKSPVRPNARKRSQPFWLWPHLLGLDAPLVALVWQEWWARNIGLSLSLAQRSVLGLGVWLIYLTDRVADISRPLVNESRPARHAFAARQRIVLTALGTTVGAALVVLAPMGLNAGEFRAGLIFLAAAGFYFWTIHRQASCAWTRRLPKEAIVGGFFAVGTGFFPVAHSLLNPSLLTAGALFGVCCFLNCALISAWERTPVDQRDPASFINSFPRLAQGGLRAACWALATVSAVLALFTQTPFLAPIALSAALLATLDSRQTTIPPNALRCLADLVLLTPLLGLVIM